MRTVCLRCGIAFFVCLFSLATSAAAQDYIYATGNPSFSLNIPVDNGFINVANGNLHLEFNIASPPQRGALNLTEKLVYDSRFWRIMPYGTRQWSPTNVINANAGWRFVTGAETGTAGLNTLSEQVTGSCDYEWSTGNVFRQYIYGFSWVDPSGTNHIFDAQYSVNTSDCGYVDGYSESVSGFATDASGYSVTMSGQSNNAPDIITIHDNNGTQVYPQVIDRFGNFLSFDSNGNVVDDTGRTPVIVTHNGSDTYYDVLSPNGTINNNGKRVRYIVTTASQSISTNFQQSGVSEWAGTLNPVQSIQLPDGTRYGFQYDPYYGELIQMDLPTGGSIGYYYSRTFDSYNNVNQWLTAWRRGYEPITFFTPSLITLCSGNSTGCAEQVVVHKPSGDEVKYRFTLNNGAWNTQTIYYNGSASSSNAITTFDTNYDFSHSCNSSICNGASYITKSNEIITLNDTGLKRQTQYIVDNPQLGKVAAIKEWSYYTNTPPYYPTHTTGYSYAGYDIYQTTILDSASNIVAQTTNTYTNSAITTTGVANHSVANAGGPYLQKVTHSSDAGPAIATTYSMDDTGMMRDIHDPKGNLTAAFTYRCANSLPDQISTSLPQPSKYDYDCDSGALINVKDPNDVAANRSGTQYTYEAVMGRPNSVSSSDGGLTTYTYPSATRVDTTVKLTPSNSVTTSSIADSYGRSYQQLIAGNVTDTTYDANGRLNCVSNPYPIGGSASSSICNSQYDGINRLKVQTLQDGATVNFSYSGNVMTSCDSAGVNCKKRTTDAFGQLTQVLEQDPNGTGYVNETDYVYNILGKLTCVEQHGNGSGTGCSSVPSFDATSPWRVRRMSYDQLGRLTTTSFPESGTTSYSYLNSNAFCSGDISAPCNITNALGVTTNYSYDSSNRLTAKHYSDSTRAQFYGYDGNTEVGTPLPQVGIQSDNAIGRLSLISDQVNVAQAYSYDSMGRIKLQNQVVPSVNNWGTLISASYDLAGNRTDLTYPDGRHVTQDWDSVGHLSNVKFADWNGQAVNYPYVSSASYAPSGAVSQMVFGNVVTTNNSFNNRFQPCEITGSFPLGVNNSYPMTAFDKQLFYSTTSGSLCGNSSSNNGNIASVIDALNVSKTQSFQYDALNRLTYAARADGAFNFNYPMDLYGNMQQTSNITGNPSISFTVNNQMQLGGNGYTYDAAGNLVDTGQPMYGGHHFTFDGEGRMTKVDAGNTASYTYDAAGQRVRKDAGGNWTEYLYFDGQMLAEKHPNNTWTDTIYANGQRIATVSPTSHRIRISGTSVQTWWENGVSLPAPPNFVVRTGDRVCWQQYNANAVGGINLQFSGGGQSAWHNQAYDGYDFNQDTRSGGWFNRCGALDEYAGQTLTGIQVLKDVYTPVGSWSVLIADWVYVRADGTVVQQLTSGQYPSLTGGSTNPQYDTSFSAVVEDVSMLQDPVVPWSGSNVQGTHYYATDHLGTARTEFASGGWPVWQGDFAPYGQEINPQQTANPYKFTGLERDSESGLDHAQFRQFSSFQGRWMSPDPYTGSIDIYNPQSLNRYSYVGNHPLLETDPTGLLSFGGNGGEDGGGIEQGPNHCGICDFFGDIFGTIFGSDPKFYGSTAPRPNAQPWDEYHIRYHADILGALGLPNQTCEFGACGGGSFQSTANNIGLGVDAVAWTYGYTMNFFWPLAHMPSKGRFPANETPRRFFGTYHCGPGGAGPSSGAGTANSLCAIHDKCFADAGVNADGNTSWDIPWSMGQVIAASNCNQKLYNAIRKHPFAIGSSSLQWWLTNGDKVGILRPGTAATP